VSAILGDVRGWVVALGSIAAVLMVALTVMSVWTAFDSSSTQPKAAAPPKSPLPVFGIPRRSQSVGCSAQSGGGLVVINPWTGAVIRPALGRAATGTATLLPCVWSTGKATHH
jgi:hypothetical protein